MDEYLIILNKDLDQCDEHASVCVTGIIHDRWGRRSQFGIAIADVTGNSVVSFSGSTSCYEKSSFTKGKRVRVFAEVGFDKHGKKCLKNVKKVEFLEELSQSNKDVDILEQESLLMMSSICNVIRNFLIDNQFVEVNTRAISRWIGDEVLEPMLVEYPGFGSSVFLVPSPSSQLSEFLTVTLLPKVFTYTTSFAMSYRFPNGSTEMPIMMAKAINMSAEDVANLIVGITKEIVDSLSNEKIKFNYVSGIWKDDIQHQKKSNLGIFTYGNYTSNIPTIGRRWNSVVHSIGRLEDDNGNLLVEYTSETVNGHADIYSITFYPSQYLNWISKAPKRQIPNLWKLYGGGNMYG